MGATGFARNAVRVSAGVNDNEAEVKEKRLHVTDEPGIDKSELILNALSRILVQQQITNQYLSNWTGETFTERDTEKI